MTLFPSFWERERLEYYIARKHGSQDIRGAGKSYSSLKETHQIGILAQISRDEVERARLESELKYFLDMQALQYEAELRGEEKGLEKGRAERDAIIAEKDAEIASKDAEIQRLLSEMQKLREP